MRGKVTRSAEARRSLHVASDVAAVDPSECLSNDAAAGLPASLTSVAADELRRSPSWPDAPNLRLPRPETTKSDRDNVESGPHMSDRTAYITQGVHGK